MPALFRVGGSPEGGARGAGREQLGKSPGAGRQLRRHLALVFGPASLSRVPLLLSLPPHVSPAGLSGALEGRQGSGQGPPPADPTQPSPAPSPPGLLRDEGRARRHASPRLLLVAPGNRPGRNGGREQVCGARVHGELVNACREGVTVAP